MILAAVFGKGLAPRHKDSFGAAKLPLFPGIWRSGVVFRDTQINKFSSIMFHRKDAESPFVSWFDHWPCSDFGSDFEVQPQDLIKVARAAVRLSHAKGPPLPVDSMCQQSQALAEHMTYATTWFTSGIGSKVFKAQVLVPVLGGAQKCRKV